MTNTQIKAIHKRLVHVLQAGMLPLGMAAEEAGCTVHEAMVASATDRRIRGYNPGFGPRDIQKHMEDFRVWLKRKGEVD